MALVGNTAVSSEVLRCALEVHRALGPGLLESAYRQCLCWELERAGIAIQVETTLPATYKGSLVEAAYRADLIVANELVLELKAVERLLPIHEAQLLTYMRMSGLKVGLLLNFNVPILKHGIRRFIL